jgi:hypothetical protein
MGFRQDFKAYSYPRGACSGNLSQILNNHGEKILCISDPGQLWQIGSLHFLLETDSVVCGYTKGLALVINSGN